MTLTTGFLVFDGNPLAVVTARLSEHFVEWVSLMYLWALQTRLILPSKDISFLVN